MRNWILRLSGLCAIFVAGNHSFVGDALLRKMTLPEEELMLVRAFHQIGAIGWVVGGILLIAAASWKSQTARNWIVAVYGIMFGFFAVGNFGMSGGQPSFGWISLALVVILAVFGRRADNKVELGGS